MVKRKNTYRQVNKRIIKITLFFGIIASLIVANVLFTMVSGKHLRSGKDVLAYKKGSGQYTEKIIANRGFIYDRNKEIIAQDIEAYDLIAVVDENRLNATKKEAYVVDVKDTCEKLAPILKTEANTLEAILNKAKKEKSFQTEFASYGKNLSAQQKEDIVNLDLPGLEFRDSTDRVYPTDHFASQLIGYAQYNDDDKKISGVMGLEKTFDKQLSGKDGVVQYQSDSKGNYLPKSKKYTKIAKNGKDVYLTIDKNVQLTLEKALADTMESNQSKYAWGIVMEAKTGKVLAQAGYPSFDLNQRDKIENHYNLPSERSFECGSVIKPFVYAGAIESGVYDPKAVFNSKSVGVGVDANGNLVRANKGDDHWIMTINDALGKDYGTIDYDEGLVRSTNTGIVNLFLNYYDLNTNIDFLKKFGFFKEIGIHGLQEDIGKLNTGSIADKVSLGFGQGSRINSYQLIQAASALFGDGKMVKPYLIDKIIDPNTGETEFKGETKKSGQIVSQATADQMKGLMKRIVEEPIGTAHRYQMSDITMMAKTGTGQIAEAGGYSTDNYTTSILAGAPSNDPEIIVYYAFESGNILSYSTSYFQEIVREALLATNSYNDATVQTTEHPLVADFNIFDMPSLINHTTSYANDKLSPYTKNMIMIGDGKSIISQYPANGVSTISSQRVFLLTDGSNIAMPNMSGWTRKDIKTFMKLSGIDIQIKGNGTVVSQSVTKGTSITNDSKIELQLK